MIKRKRRTKEMLEYLQVHKSITTMEAIHKFNTTRPAVIIASLRTEYDIETIMMRNEETGRIYGKYVYHGELEGVE